MSTSQTYLIRFKAGEQNKLATSQSVFSSVRHKTNAIISNTILQENGVVDDHQIAVHLAHQIAVDGPNVEEIDLCFSPNPSALYK